MGIIRTAEWDGAITIKVPETIVMTENLGAVGYVQRKGPDMKLEELTLDIRQMLYERLSSPFQDPKSVERTRGTTTGKGYDTTGIKYQYVVNRFNEVLGLGNWRTFHEIECAGGKTAKGRDKFDAISHLTIQLIAWDGNEPIAWASAESYGGHTSSNIADAKKGAYTNAFKKAAAMFGCGQQAYMGTLDDDNTPAIDGPPERPDEDDDDDEFSRARPVNGNGQDLTKQLVLSYIRGVKDRDGWASIPGRIKESNLQSDQDIIKAYRERAKEFRA